MAYVGNGTLAGGISYASGQILWQLEWVLDDGDTLYLPVFRMPGVPNLSVVVSNVLGHASPVDVDVTVWGGTETGPVTGDLISTGRFRPIRQTVNLVAPVGGAREQLWPAISHPSVILQITDARVVPAGPFPFLVSLGASN